MKRIGIAFAALALILMSCNKEELTVERAPRTVTVTASIASPDDAHTRYTLAPTDPTGTGKLTYGLEFKFEENDVVRFYYWYSGAYYKSSNIMPDSISLDGKQAYFTVPIPTEIPEGATFNLYTVYMNINDVGSTWGTGYNKLKDFEYDFVDLEGTNKIRPLLRSSQEGIVNTETPEINHITLEHIGWVMAVHLKNNSAAEISYPNNFVFQYALTTGWCLNGHNAADDVYMAVNTGQVMNGGSGADDKLMFNTYSSSAKIAAGASKTFYRWVISRLNGTVPSLSLYVNSSTLITNFPERTVENGKVYHTYVEWDGTQFKTADPF